MVCEHSRFCRAATIPALLLVILAGRPARAYTLLPLVTEEAAPIPSGIVQATIGLSYMRDGNFPFFTQPDSLQSQDVIGLPQFAVRIGAGGWVEIQVGYQLVYLDQRTADGQTDSEYGSGDGTIFTKVRVLREGEMYPALGIRFGTKLPNGTSEKHLGTDETDFSGEILASKGVGPVILHANLGLALLGIPRSEPGQGGQDDLVSYALAVVSRPLWGDDSPETTRLTLLGEVAGLTGSRFSNDRAAVRAGMQLVHGHAMVSLGLSTGLISESEQFGANAGFTYTFDIGKLFTGE